MKEELSNYAKRSEEEGITMHRISVLAGISASHVKGLLEFKIKNATRITWIRFLPALGLNEDEANRFLSHYGREKINSEEMVIFNQIKQNRDDIVRTTSAYEKAVKKATKYGEYLHGLKDR
jgi:hypothetical protein